MAQASARICSNGLCGNLTYSRFCQKHDRPDEVRAAYPRAPDHRGTSASRGYDSKWRSLRNSFIMHNPLCSHCTERGKTSMAVDVDHIIPFQSLHDPLRLKWENLQSLCRPCHRRKTAKDKRNGL